ncbi:flagellar biosynthetic protein FliO [Cellvibrio sp. PSBB023]|uniref:flagellar biosynthetic protein FliO n=1 Tax=Cellvibrio sp. PSBB023 TaxID=1945512 RepID=UPI00098EBF37|nr:flagellar biosynthetic protein FliO [Cellvibrio sp. PSBB023]
MSPALFMMLKRLFCAGLCCIALYSYADPASDTPVAATESQPQSAAPTSAQANATSTTATPITATPVATSPAAINATPIGGGRHLVSVTLALFGIIALIVAISWFVKRFGQGGFTQNQHIKIISAMPLGTRERILLVDAGGQQLLLGITATTINTLHVFNEPVVLAEKDDRASDFSRKLMTILQQKSPGANGEQNNNNDSAAR